MFESQSCMHHNMFWLILVQTRQFLQVCVSRGVYVVELIYFAELLSTTLTYLQSYSYSITYTVWVTLVIYTCLLTLYKWYSMTYTWKD